MGYAVRRGNGSGGGDAVAKSLVLLYIVPYNHWNAVIVGRAVYLFSHL